MKYILPALLLALAGCAASPETKVVYETKYVVRTALDEQKALPVRVNERPSNDAELSQWILHTESYITLLEAKFKSLILFYEKPID